MQIDDSAQPARRRTEANGAGSARAPAAEMRQQLLTQAKELFSQQGYVGASLRGLAEQSGITAAAVYYHFAKKEDLLREIVFEGLERLSQSVFAALAETASPEERLEAVVRTHLRYNVEFPREARIIIEESRFLNQVDYAAAREKQNAVLNIYRTCIRQLITAGQLPDVDPSVTAFSITSVILGWYRWYREGGALSKQDAFEFTVAFAMAGVLGLRQRLAGAPK